MYFECKLNSTLNGFIVFEVKKMPSLLGNLTCIRSTIRAARALLPRKDTMTSTNTGAYSADNNLVDYILGITYEIWEEGAVDLIEQYYGPKTLVFGLDGITHGAAGSIAGTREMLAAFPDRLLLGDDVIGSGDVRSGYSSHRVLSPMTNKGDSLFGPATQKQVRIMNMADCAIEEGVIVEEWLARDNLALVRQLGFDVMDSARVIAARHTDELKGWFADEATRLRKGPAPDAAATGIDHQALLHALWISGDERVFESAYTHYSVLHRSPIEIVSGGPAIARHYADLRNAFTIDGASIDHVCMQNGGEDVDNVALRWTVCGEHSGNFLEIGATGKRVFIMGVTHRRIVNGRIAAEWTVFDSLGVAAQLL
jgi:predicted ester cyclase